MDNKEILAISIIIINSAWYMWMVIKDSKETGEAENLTE